MITPRKLVTTALLLIIGGLLLRLSAGDGSLVHIYLLKKNIAVLEKSAEQKQQRNEQLERITLSLKKDLDMIETIARRDMDMVRQDEVFFVDN